MIQAIRNFLTRGRLEDPSVPLSKAYDLLADMPSSSGVAVNQKTTLSNPAVWRGVNLISQSVAKLPLIVYRRGPNDSRERATAHPAYRLLKKQPNEVYSAYTFKQTLQAHALIYGNGFAYIYRSPTGSPVELLILDPEVTYPVREGGKLHYVTTLDNQDHKLAFADVLHIKGLSFDGLVGYSLLDIMKDALGLGISLQRYGSYYFRNAARPSLVIELPPNLRDPEKIERFRTTWGTMHQGLENAHRPALLQSGSKLQTLGGDNDSGQYIQSRSHDLILVADILGLPPHKLGANIATSYGSLESENKAFLSDSLDGWLTAWEQELEVKLLSERQKALDTHFVEYERKALVQMDSKTETDLLIAEVNNGLLSWEEARAIRNLPTEKDEAQEWRRPANIQVEGEEPEQPPAPPTDAPVDEPPEPEDNSPEPTDEPSEPSRAILRGLLASDLGRLLKRLQKAVEGGHDLTKHRAVMIDSLQAFPRAEAFTDQFLTNLSSELEAVLPEQRQEVFSRVDVDNLIEELWKDVA